MGNREVAFVCVFSRLFGVNSFFFPFSFSPMYTRCATVYSCVGKSSVINSLLGAKYLAEGILPTTNEISVLKHAADGDQRVS